MTETTRAVVIEGVALVRAGIASVLRERDVAVVAEASSSAQASALVRGTDAHLLVVGDDGDGADLLRAIRRVKQRDREVRVVVLLPQCTSEVLYAVLDAGADGVVPSEADREELLAAVDAVRAGECHVDPSLAAALFAGIKASDCLEAPRFTGGLTIREHGVVRLLAEARTNDEIAQLLLISAATVKTHLSNVYAKLGARNRYDAVVKATRLGVL